MIQCQNLVTLAAAVAQEQSRREREKERRATRRDNNDTLERYSKENE